MGDEAVGVATVAWTALAAAALALVLSFARAHRRRGGEGGPPEHWLFYSTLGLLRNFHRLLDYMHEQHLEHGRTWSGKIWGQPRIFYTSDPENLRHIGKDAFANYGKGPQFHERFKILLGDGIFNVDSAAWYVHRKVSAGLFNVANFRDGVLPVVNKTTDALMAMLREIAGGGSVAYPPPRDLVFDAASVMHRLGFSGFEDAMQTPPPAAASKAEGKEPSPQWTGDACEPNCGDLQNLLHRFMLDAVGRIAFGENIDALGTPDLPVARAFDYCQRYTNVDLFVPFWRWRRWLLPSGRRFREHVRVLDDFAFDIVRRRRRDFAEAEPTEGADKQADLLSLFLSGHKVTKDTDISDRYLRDVIMNFLIAGRDTTAQALSWTFYALAKHREAQEKVAAEARAVLGTGRGGGDRHLTYAELGKLAYTTAAFQESLRLYPPVAKNARIAVKADVWPDGTQIPAGAWAAWVPYSMGRTPELWGEDCEEYRPERFLDAPLKPSPFKYPAFNFGPRTCLGQNMALLEARVLLARILAEFTVTLPDNAPEIKYEDAVTLPMRFGLWLRFEKREAAEVA